MEEESKVTRSGETGLVESDTQVQPGSENVTQSSPGSETTIVSDSALQTTAQPDSGSQSTTQLHPGDHLKPKIDDPDKFLVGLESIYSLFYSRV